MPIYDYICSDCGLKFERVVKHYDEEVVCPRCHGIGERQISVPFIKVDSAQDIPWLRDWLKCNKSLEKKGVHITTRTAYNQYVKENDLRPVSGENLSEV